MKILRLEDVSIRYGALMAVKNVSFSVDEGECLCLLGANGSGKSTLLRGILGLVPLAGGSVVKPPRTAWMPQTEETDRNFPATVREIVLTGRQRPGWRLPFYSRADREAADRALNELGIAGLASRSMGALSGGQRQSVYLARALCGQPKLLLLDEPCAGLDDAMRSSFYNLLGRLCHEKKTAAVMVTHDPGETAALAGRVAVLEAGRLVFIGPPEKAGERERKILRRGH